MEMRKAKTVEKLLSAIQDLECFRDEMRRNLSKLSTLSGVDCDYSKDSYELDASVDIEKVLGDVDSVKYKSYQFTITQIENKIKELEGLIARL